jgi:hypothetical protein
MKVTKVPGSRPANVTAWSTHPNGARTVIGIGLPLIVNLSEKDVFVIEGAEDAQRALAEIEGHIITDHAYGNRFKSLPLVDFLLMGIATTGRYSDGSLSVKAVELWISKNAWRIEAQELTRPTKDLTRELSKLMRREFRTKSRTHRYENIPGYPPTSDDEFGRDCLINARTAAFMRAAVEVVNDRTRHSVHSTGTASLQRILANCGFTNEFERDRLVPLLRVHL